MPFISVGETIKSGLQSGPTRRVILSLKVEEAFNRLLPRLLPKLTKEVVFRSFREGKLKLSSSSAVASQETYLQGRRIEQELNKDLGKDAVEKIGLRISNWSNF